MTTNTTTTAPVPATAPAASLIWPVIPSRLEIAERCAPLEGKVVEVERRAAELAIDIETEEQAQVALEYINFIQKGEQSIEKRRKDYVDPPNLFVKTLNEIVKGYTGRMNTARRTLSDKLLAYQQKKRAEAEAKAAAQRKAEEEEALKRAEKLQAAGNTEAANKLLDIAATAPAPKVDSKIRSESGVKSVTTVYWVGEVTDKIEVLKAVIAGKFSLDAITIGQKQLNDFAKANQGSAGQVLHGIKVVKDERLGSR